MSRARRRAAGRSHPPRPVDASVADRNDRLLPEPSAASLGWIDLPFAAAAAVGPLLVYAVSMSDAVMLEDDGLFLMAGAHLGIAHPPGYPLYTLLVHLFMQLPFGTPALMGHFSSAVFGALACGALYGCARLTGVSPVPALVAAWLFGTQEHVFSQAVIAEVYSLNLLLLFAMYGLLLAAARRPERRGLWIAVAACYGLGLANHWPLLGLATPGLVLLAWPALKAAPRHLPTAITVAAACPALLYGWMAWRSHQDLVIAFHDPIPDLAGFWHYFIRADYGHVDASVTAGWFDRLAFLQWFATETVTSFTPAGFLLAALGLWALLRTRRLEAWGSIAIWAGQSVVLLLLLRFDFDYLQVGIFRPYSLACYGLLALWLGVGLEVSGRMLRRRFPSLAWSSILPALQGALGAIPLALAYGNWADTDHSNGRFTETFANMVFGQLPQDALLLTFDDIDVGILGYHHFVEDERPDVLMLNTQGLVFTNRLFSSRTPVSKRHAAIAEFVAGESRRIFTFPGRDISWCEGCGTRHTGFLVELLPDDPDVVKITISQAADRYFRRLLEISPSDAWAHRARGLQLRGFGQYLGRILRYKNAELIDRAAPLIALGERDVHFLMGVLGEILEHWDERNLAQAERWIARMRELAPDTRLIKNERGELFTMDGFVHYHAGDEAAAKALWRESLSVDRHPDNQARGALRALGVDVDVD